MNCFKINSVTRDNFIQINCLTKPSKIYLIDPELLKKAAELGAGTQGRVVRAKCIVLNSTQNKEKEYAFKIIYFSKDCADEFDCHQKIIRLLEQKKEVLLQQGIVAGTGIEKKSIGVSGSTSEDFWIMKKLYDKNLAQAISEGYFADPQRLISGARQLVEGIFSLISIGALYFDVKAANILIRNRAAFELACTDFEKVTFLNFDENDLKLVQTVAVRMPPFWAHERELKDLWLNQKKVKTVEEFLAKLHKLYSFVLGSAFFEMSAQISLKKFLLTHYFSEHMQKDGASDASIQKLWDKAKAVPHKKISEIMYVLDNKYWNHFDLVSNTEDFDLQLMDLPDIQKAIGDKMRSNQAPEYFIELVAAMLQTDRDKRISIAEALKVLQ